MATFNETTLALYNITDEGFFEKLATAVMRSAKPDFYGNFIHTGVNASGKTIKSPVDCIGYIFGACPPHIIFAHHTISAKSNLKKKWLLDLTQTNPHKKSKPSLQEGDVVKTMRIVKEEREKNPNLQATLALTTNQEPSEDLIRAIHAAEEIYEINIDIWSASRIADYLDDTADGQWLRQRYLGIDQQRLSRGLLHKLSLNNINAYYPLVKKDEIIKRELDDKLQDEPPRPLAFIVGESGCGKTIACYKQLQKHIDSGGFGLVISHTTLENSSTLEMAIDTELRKLHPSLVLNSGRDAQAFCSLQSPFLVVVEDINQAKEPQSLIEQLLKWSKTPPTNNEHLNWRLLCPTQPQVIHLTNRLDIQELINGLSILAASFTADEARSALERRALNNGITLSSLDAYRIAKILGNDPFLIALYDFSSETAPEQVISNFIKTQIRSLAEGSSTDTTADYQSALKTLACGMLIDRKMEPNYSELKEWFLDYGSDLTLIKKLAHNRSVIRFVEEKLIFRHDRIRTWILADAVSKLISSDQIEDGILSEPFFSEIIGTALVKNSILTNAVSKIQLLNPLALFYAIKIFSGQKKLPPQSILDAIDGWLLDNKTHAPSNDSLRWETLYLLSKTESEVVNGIIEKFQLQSEQNSIHALRARCLNGDLNAALALCLYDEPGTYDPWRERLIMHMKAHFGMNVFSIPKAFEI